MARGFMTIAAMLLCGPAVYASGDKPSWVKWEQAQALSAQTGLPILVYATVDQKGGGC